MRLLHTVLFAAAVVSMTGCSDEATAKKAIKKAKNGEKLTGKEFKAFKSYMKKRENRDLTDEEARGLLASYGVDTATKGDDDSGKRYRDTDDIYLVPKVVTGSVFSGPEKAGDFSWMIKQPKYSRALFIFNDNEEQFDAFLSGDRKLGCANGSGNAGIREYQCAKPRRAAGIPTGSYGVGYASLTLQVKLKIDQAVDEIKKLIKTGYYNELIISKNAKRETLGTGIFKVGDDVRDYIYKSVHDLLTAEDSPQ